MKIKIRPGHASTLQMNDWLTRLRDGKSARPAAPGYADPCGPGPSGPGYAKPTRYVGAVPAGHGYAEPAVGSVRPEALAGPAAPAALASRDPGRAGRGYPPLSLAELEWHHDYPADEAHPRWQISGKPSRRIHTLVVALNPARAWRAYCGRQAAPHQDPEHSEDLVVLERARACSACAMNSTR